MSTTLVFQGPNVNLGWTLTSLLTIANSVNSNQIRFQPGNFSSGTGGGQTDRIFAANDTIAPSGSVTYTFTNYVDFFGNTVSMARVKVIWVDLFVGNATGGQASSVEVGNALHPFVNWLNGDPTATVQVRQGGAFMLSAPSKNDSIGYPVTASSHDQLKILNDDSINIANVRTVISGCSA